ncbi:hypothetical protein [Catenulispora acidiphila]|nr:hypothetical protein [Catenulispora acidiphila]
MTVLKALRRLWGQVARRGRRRASPPARERLAPVDTDVAPVV